MKHYFLPLLFLLSLPLVPAFAQKRKLTPADYTLWYLPAPGALSDNGHWCYYTLHYATGDTLVVSSLEERQNYTVKNSLYGKFSADSNWFAASTADSLVILDLQNNRQRSMSGIEEFFFAGANTLITVNAENSKKKLYISKPGGENLMVFDSVMCYKEGPALSIAIIQRLKYKNILHVLDCNTLDTTTVTLPEMDGMVKRIVWSEDNKSLLLYGTQDGSATPVLVHVALREATAAILDNRLLPDGASVSEDYLSIGAGGTTIFFNVMPAKSENQDAKGIQVWRSQALTPTPPSDGQQAYCWVWHTGSGYARPLENDSLSGIVISANPKYALLFNHNKYQPQHKYGGPVMDVYLADTETGSIKKVLEQHPDENYYTSLSPEGKYISYYKEGNWWAYDVGQDIHRCVTRGVKTDWENREYDYSGFREPCGTAGWSNGDADLYLYDNFDIWRVKPDGSNAVRVTNGMKKSMRYRIGYTTPFISRSRSPRFESYQLDLEKGVLLHAVNTTTGSNSLFNWNHGQALQLLDSGDKNIYAIKKAAHRDVYLYLESSFGKPPALKIALPGKPPRIILQSNQHQERFNWGYSRLIHYSSGGKHLKGVLCYPASYDPAKKYPMVVNIYQRQYALLHEYQLPTLNEPNGFNASVYTVEGYFVLYPDIAYQINEPMESALRDVTVAVKQATRSAAIDKGRIGLIGHSFGGAETTYIIGHSKLFRTAVAGAPVTDFTSSYLGYDGYGASNMWRFENQQFRITAPFYSSAFKNNSPLLSAQHITAPLLLWSGTKDMSVDFNHSKKLYTALWRLGKECTLIFYEGEGHLLMSNEEYQRDISLRTMEWFDHYLKNKPCPAWK